MFLDPYQIRRAIRDGISLSVVGGINFSAGTLSSVRSDITFSNGSGVSFGLDAAGVITASVAPAAGGLTNIKISAGILSELRSDITFSNANGVTFGLAAGGVITASVAAGGGQTTQPVAASASNGSFLFSTVGFSNANGVTFGTSVGNIVTASVSTNYQSPGAYLTTAALSGDTSLYAGTGFTSTTTAGTAVVATLNTSGLSMGIPAYLTTASILFAAQGASNSLTGVLFLDSNNVTFGLAGDIYTASAAINVSASGGSALMSRITFDNSNGVTFGLAASVITASIATTYAGTGFTSTTTAGTAVVATLNTSGLSMGIPAYLTTGAAFTPRLDQVLNPANDVLFVFTTGDQIQFQFSTIISGE